MVNPRRTKKPKVTKPKTQRKTSAATKSTPAKSKVPGAVPEVHIKRTGGFFNDSIDMVWARPDSEDPIVQYQIQYQVKTQQGGTGEWSDFSNPYTGTVTQWKISNVPQASRFNFRIRAKNEHGWGAWSKSFPES